MKKMKVMTIFGTRPEAIKMAPLVLELKNHSDKIETIVTVTAQHREMLDQVLRLFSITPDFDLNIMHKNQSLIDITNRALIGLDKVMKEANPDLVLVHGDTSTTFVASLAAFYNQIDVGHVEAGLRTWNKLSPYPEEMNRQLTGVIADMHFAPTEKAKQNLLKEDKKDEHIYVTGNTAIDALHTTVTDTYSHTLLDDLGDKRLILVTAHRRENLGKKMEEMFQAIRKLVDSYEDIQVIYPVHLNPAVKELADKVLGKHERIKLIDPLDVIDFHNFLAKSHLILTDSGGIQEEAPSLGVPVLVLRDTTERPEGVEAGTLQLVGTDQEKIFESASALLTDQKAYNKMAKAINPYGDGKASQRIVEAIIEHYLA